MIFNVKYRFKICYFLQELKEVKQKLAAPLPDLLSRSELVEINDIVDDIEGFSLEIIEHVMVCFVVWLCPFTFMIM